MRSRNIIFLKNLTKVIINSNLILLFWCFQVVAILIKNFLHILLGIQWFIRYFEMRFAISWFAKICSLSDHKSDYTPDNDNLDQNTYSLHSISSNYIRKSTFNSCLTYIKLWVFEKFFFVNHFEVNDRK
jgi:hypothetical protein